MDDPKSPKFFPIYVVMDYRFVYNAEPKKSQKVVSQKSGTNLSIKNWT